MKDRILELRGQGKSYSEIQEILGCSKSTISYHCNPKVKEQTNLRTKKRRAEGKRLPWQNSLYSKVAGFKRLKKGQKKRNARLLDTLRFNEKIRR